MKSALKRDSAFGEIEPEFDDLSSSDGCMVPEDEEFENALRDEDDQFVNAGIKRFAERIGSLRLIILALIISFGLILSVCSYYFVNREDDELGNAKYESSVGVIAQTVEERMVNLRLAFRSLGETVTAASLSSQMDFPCVTVPFFEIHAHNARMISQADVVGYSPVVGGEEMDDWANCTLENQGWIEESSMVSGDAYEASYSIPTFIFELEVDSNSDNKTSVPANGPAPYSPVWQSSPLYETIEDINFDVFSGSDNSMFRDQYDATVQLRDGTFSPSWGLETDSGTVIPLSDALQFSVLSDSETFRNAQALFLYPVFATFEEEAPVVALVYGLITWTSYFANVLPNQMEADHCLVVSNDCDQALTYVLNGSGLTFMGFGDYHDRQWDGHKRTVSLGGHSTDHTNKTKGQCTYALAIYPNDSFWDHASNSTLPIALSSVVAIAFVTIACVFAVYDVYVRKTTRTVTSNAERSNAFIASLFPSNVRDRVIASREPEELGTEKNRRDSRKVIVPLNGFLTDDSEVANDIESLDSDLSDLGSPPIADLFPETTIIFADIAGFTAWSSAREPAQVFVLLETLYRSFDAAAKKRRIFKVETIGDCYVAVSGVPDPRADHAVAMVRFAKDCLFKTRSLLRKLEKKLGPGTGALAMRIGIHSGPVTGGVLRGENSRFQLFGDTMNTASRIETTGKRDRIHISSETAELLVEAGKSRWLVPRDEKVYAKGKGEMRTYWLLQSIPKGERPDQDSMTDDTSYTSDSSWSFGSRKNTMDSPCISKKTAGLVDWNADLLLRYLRVVLAGDAGVTKEILLVDHGDAPKNRDNCDQGKSVGLELSISNGTNEGLSEPFQVDPGIEEQVHIFVHRLALLYKENAFHNFEHASHVSMSVAKLLSGMTLCSQPGLNQIAEDELTDNSLKPKEVPKLSIDPRLQFASMFAALIHDVGHNGTSNQSLSEDASELATGHEVTTKVQLRSFQIAWDLFTESEFSAFRTSVCHTTEEEERFRQLVLDLVLATDLEDDDQMKDRQERWRQAFCETERATDSTEDLIALRSKVAMEYLVQASTISHTMQHWHVYFKWSSALLRDDIRNGNHGTPTGDKEASSAWYDEQLEFFDSRVIPVARKLGCDVFGPTGKQYLDYATRNQSEWKQRGEQLVSDILADMPSQSAALEQSESTVD